MDPAVRSEIDALRSEVANAADAIMTLVEGALARIGAGSAPSELAGDLHGMMEACVFGDLAAQRLSTLEALLGGTATAHPDPLMNGPAQPGDGLDQAAADALWAATAPTAA